MARHNPLLRDIRRTLCGPRFEQEFDSTIALMIGKSLFVLIYMYILPSFSMLYVAQVRIRYITYLLSAHIIVHDTHADTG